MNDFFEKISRCRTLDMLERLHDHVRKTVPAEQRQHYIELLNVCEDNITKGYYNYQIYLGCNCYAKNGVNICDCGYFDEALACRGELNAASE